MENYKWKFGYVDDGLGVKFSKVDGEKEISYITIDNNSFETVMSDDSDEDLQKIKFYYTVGMGQMKE